VFKCLHSSEIKSTPVLSKSDEDVLWVTKAMVWEQSPQLLRNLNILIVQNLTDCYIFNTIIVFISILQRVYWNCMVVIGNTELPYIVSSAI